MTRLRFLCLSCMLISGVVTSPAIAAKETAQEKLEKRTEQLLSVMDDQQKAQFADIRMGHGVVRAVEYTNRSIDQAVRSCVKHNPPLKAELTALHKNWKANLNPVLRRGQDRVDQMVKRQRIDKPLVIRSYLKEYDLAATEKSSKIKEIPIKSMDECKKLSSKMKSVQGELVSLITDTLKLNQDF